VSQVIGQKYQYIKVRLTLSTLTTRSHTHCPQLVYHLILPRYSPNIPIHLFRIINTYSRYLFSGNLLQHASLAAVCMLKPMVRMSTKVLHTCTTAQGTLFLCEIPQLKSIVLCSIWSFEVQRRTGAVLGKNWDASDHCSLCAILDSNSNVSFH
jgi:hypothetical protein